MRLILIRHGEKQPPAVRRDKNLRELLLTSKGIEQAESTGKFLATLKIDFFASSPSERTFHSATISRTYAWSKKSEDEVREHPILVLPHFRERMGNSYETREAFDKD